METGILNTKSTLFADVILPLPLPKLYTYSISSEQLDKAKEGSRVIVQFGKSRVLTALIANIHSNAPFIYEAKPILEILDEDPSVQPQQLQLFQWIADYYMCTIGEVFNAALPSGLKIHSESRIQLNPEFNNDKISFSNKEEMLIEVLRTKETLSYSEVSKVLGQKNIYHILNSLLKKERIIVFEEVREKYAPKIIKKIKLHSNYVSKAKLEALFEVLEKKPKQADVLLKYLQQVPVFENADLNQKGVDKSLLIAAISASALNTLIKNGIFIEEEVVVSRFPEYVDSNIQINLSAEQEKAKKEIHELLQTKEAVLLHGITGSGKTEVFISLIKEALESGTQVLYLLPEIALTTQIVNRLRKIFGNKMGVYHSKFSDNERVEVWKKLSNGELSFIVGVRSSVFLPFNNLGLIVIDEEHETSYKQYDPAPRYNARDTALVLAKIHHAKTLLGSATPSVESYHNTESGKWGLVKMKKRFGDAKLPEIVLVNMKEERKHRRVKHDFSDYLLNEIKFHIDHHQQVILFQNRRGYAPYLYCEDCAHIPKCKNCAVSLTYHMYSKDLKCHYCGHLESVPTHCEACGSTKIKTVGFGTEKIEDEMKIFFPEANIERMDLDTTKKKDSFQKIINDFEERKTDILVGTQMVSKGLDFDHVNLVGIFDADRMIHFPDFRSYERAFQMIMQVSGRAGRREKRGKVIIQTFDPDQSIFSKIVNHDYEGMYQDEIYERKKFAYPPFVRMIKLTVKDPDRAICRKAANKLQETLAKHFGPERVLGPEFALIEKLRNNYQMEVLLKLERGKINMQSVKELILSTLQQILLEKEFKTSSIIPDCDPI